MALGPAIAGLGHLFRESQSRRILPGQCEQHHVGEFLTWNLAHKGPLDSEHCLGVLVQFPRAVVNMR